MTDDQREVLHRIRRSDGAGSIHRKPLDEQLRAQEPTPASNPMAVMNPDPVLLAVELVERDLGIEVAGDLASRVSGIGRVARATLEERGRLYAENMQRAPFVPFAPMPGLLPEHMRPPIEPLRCSSFLALRKRLATMGAATETRVLVGIVAELLATLDAWEARGEPQPPEPTAEDIKGPPERPPRVSFCWAKRDNEWWLAVYHDGEPFEAYHQQHGRMKAYRDTFSHWSHGAETPAPSSPQPPPEGWAEWKGHGRPGYVYGVYSHDERFSVTLDADGLHVSDDFCGNGTGVAPPHVALHVLAEAARRQGGGK